MSVPEPKGLKRWARLARSRPTERLGFFTTRCVEAVNADAAGELALKLVADELRERKIIQNPASNPPTLTIAEVRNLAPSELTPSTKGFSFFPEEKMH